MKEPGSKRLRYILVGLITIVGVLTSIVVYDRFSWGNRDSAAEQALLGTWLGNDGHSLQLRPDGSAIGRIEGHLNIGIYRWKVENGVVSIEDCPINPGPQWFAQKCFEDFMNASRRDDYEMTKQGNEVLVLTDLVSSRVLEYERAKD